jgi:hypothetical protein
VIVQNKLIFIVFFLFAVIVSAAGERQKIEWKGSIDEKNGVKVIKNPKKPIYGEDVFSLEEELCIGKGNEKQEYIFIRLWYLVVDEEENIYAMDQGESHIKVFDKNGTLLRAIGKKGEGPGELAQPNEIFVTGGNQLVVDDYIRNLTYYSLDGKFIKAQSTAKIFPVGILIDSLGRILAMTNINEPDKSGKEIVLYDENLNYLKTIISIPKPRPNPQILEPFQPEINWALSKDNSVIISFKEEFELQVFNAQGKLSKKITKEHEPVKITEQDVKQRIRRVPEGRKLVVPKYFPAVHSLTADDEGRIFVHTYEKAEEGKFYNDVFDSEGRYIARVSLKDILQVWKKQKLYSIEEDEEGYQFIKRYKVKWKY